MMKFNISPTRNLRFDIQQSQQLAVKVNLGVPSRPLSYTGETEVTPSNVAQTLSTANRYMETDVMIGAIPNNYGLVTFSAAIPTAANITIS